MKSFLWTVAGLLCGFAVGIIVPLGLAYQLIYSGGDTNGIGTPLVFMAFITVPMGMMLGAYAGWYRARTGHWSGVFDASTQTTRVQSSTLTQDLTTLDKQFSGRPEAETASARADYLRELIADYETTKPNYGLFGVWIVASLIVPIFVVVPIARAWKHYRRKKAMNEHIKQVMSERSINEATFL